MAMKYDINMKERYLAIVLLDLIGSTAFVQRAGAHVAAQWFQVHDRLARSLVYKHSGREIDRSDGFLLSFDKIGDAINFGLAYQRTVPKKTRLQTRIGIHWGKIVEVKQDDVFVGAGAKRVELEGLAKNIAARTMSLCQAGQVLLTKEAIVATRGRTANKLPRDARYVCVGVYRFKGVSKPQEIYAVGETIQSLQPPKGSDKVKRLGGPKYIRKKARDRKFLDWASWVFWRAGILATLFWLWVFFQMSLRPTVRSLMGMDYHMPKYDSFIEFVSDSYKKVKKDLTSTKDQRGNNDKPNK
jgi:class 3 adenylate cyclase